MTDQVTAAFRLRLGALMRMRQVVAQQPNTETRVAEMDEEIVRLRTKLGKDQGSPDASPPPAA